MPSIKTRESLSSKGLNIKDPYNRYDSLATEHDLSALFEVLGSFKNYRGKHPIMTINCLTANPDFDRIRSSNYEQYFFEPFTETLQKSLNCKNSFTLWKVGIDHGLWRPQFHGREHLNITSWLTALQQQSPDALLGFNYGFWGHSIRDQKSRRTHYLAAYDFETPQEIDFVCRAAIEGMELFEKQFGYQSKSFIAPNFVWSPHIEKALFTCGATLIQSQRNQLIPVTHTPGYQTKFHYTGQKNRLGQRYLVRNAYFEPSLEPSYDWIGSCLKDISRAFFWKTPAIISAHRVNFIGAIVPENRDRNLTLLKELIKQILTKWPDVEFMTSDQLGDSMWCNATS